MASHKYKPDNCEDSKRDTGDSNVSPNTDAILQDKDDFSKIFAEDEDSIMQVGDEENNFNATDEYSYDLGSFIDYGCILHCESREDTDLRSSTCTSVADSYDSYQEDSILPDEDEIEDYEDLLRRAYESPTDEFRDRLDVGKMPIIKKSTCSSKEKRFTLGQSTQDTKQCTDINEPGDSCEDQYTEGNWNSTNGHLQNNVDSSVSSTADPILEDNLDSNFSLTNTSDAILQENDDFSEIYAEDSTRQEYVAEFSEIHSTENTSLHHNSVNNINEPGGSCENQYTEGNWNSTNEDLQNNVDSSTSPNTGVNLQDNIDASASFATVPILQNDVDSSISNQVSVRRSRKRKAYLEFRDEDKYKKCPRLHEKEATGISKIKPPCPLVAWKNTGQGELNSSQTVNVNTTVYNNCNTEQTQHRAVNGVDENVINAEEEAKNKDIHG